jgi:hypothetical protein
MDVHATRQLSLRFRSDVPLRRYSSAGHSSPKSKRIYGRLGYAMAAMIMALRFLVLYLRPSVLPGVRCLLSYCAVDSRPLLSSFITFVVYFVIHYLCVTSKLVDFCKFFVCPWSLIFRLSISVIVHMPRDG